MTLTPSPRRRAQMLQAHALRSRGFTIEQIGDATDQAPSTVHTLLRDFELEREHLVAAVAQDQLLVLLHSQAELLRLHELHPPRSPDHADSRNRQLQALAALARELRLVCALLLRSKDDHIFQYEQPEHLELSDQDLDAVEPLAQLQGLLANLLEPPAAAPEIPQETEASRTEPNSSGKIEPDLEVSERPRRQSSVHNGKTSKSARKNKGAAPAPKRPPKGALPPPTLPRPKRNSRPTPG
ncbi:MAG: hypothetical protein OXS30_12215 [Chloroflexota bacterium]|nr:hypothetical protein [Chloroflexota bacterium]